MPDDKPNTPDETKIPGEAGTLDRTKPQGGALPASASDPITFDRIRERAYELWERNHRPDGFEIEFWLLAERELRNERQNRRAAEPPAPADPDPQPR